MSFREVSTKDFETNPFKLFADQWVLITAKKGEKVNTMTAAWGGLGHVWLDDVVTVYIRHNRYTKEFVDNADSFSVTAFDEKYRDALKYLGTVSGKNDNKIEKAGLTVVYEDDIPYFEEAKQVILAKKLYAQELEKEKFIDQSIVEKVYKDNDFHTIYIGGVKKILVK